MIRQVREDRIRRSGIYVITNKINGKEYIGSSVYIKHRWTNHLRDLRNNKHHSSHLQNSWNKYGEDSFSFDILEEVKDKNNLIEREQFYINCIKPEYNVQPSARSSLGLKRGPLTPKHKATILEANKKTLLARNAERDKQIMNLYYQNFSRRKIAEVVNIQRWQVGRIIKKNIVAI